MADQTDRDAVAATLAARTEGPDRIGTARWSPCCRDAYSLAIEEAAAVLAPLLAQARAEATAAALAPVERLVGRAGLLETSLLYVEDVAAAVAQARAEAGAHHPRCYQNTGVPDDLPPDVCDCRVLRMIDKEAGRG